MAASQPRSNSQINSQLSRDQQNLLLAALNAQAGDGQTQYQPAGTSEHTDSSALQSAAMNASDQNNLFISPQSAELDNFNDFTPDLDYLDGDNSFDFDNADLGGEMIGALPGSGGESPEEDIIKGELHDKRKSPGDSQDGEEGDAKRQEGEKGNKKPGRKPLTSEPTTVSSILISFLLSTSTHFVIRNARPKTALPSVHSVNARKSTSRTLKRK